MSKRLTVAQLVAQLEAAHAACERVSAERDSLRAECEALRTKRPAPRAALVHTFEYGNRDSFLAAMNAARTQGGVVRRAA